MVIPSLVLSLSDENGNFLYDNDATDAATDELWLAAAVVTNGTWQPLSINKTIYPVFTDLARTIPYTGRIYINSHEWNPNANDCWFDNHSIHIAQAVPMVIAYKPEILETHDYYAFGSQMPGRTYPPPGAIDEYKYGQNGQEKDNVIALGIYTAEYWEYDSRLGRRWNIDPIPKPHESPYATFANNPIWLVDINGLDSTLYVNKTIEGGKYNLNNPEELRKLEAAIKEQLNIAKLGFMKIKYVDNTYDMKLDKSDQVLSFNYNRSATNEQGVTPGSGGQYQYSSINLAAFSNLSEYNGLPSMNGDLTFHTNGAVMAANTAVHEITHGFLERSFAFYGISSTLLGGDAFGHFDSKSNLMNSGDTRMNNNSNKLILGKTHSTQIIPIMLQKVIFSWLKSNPELIITPFKPFKAMPLEKSPFIFPFRN